VLELTARRAKHETQRNFGNSIALFTPLYISNYCENACTYCGFRCTSKLKRAKLTFDEIHSEFKAISATGLDEILILTGESENAANTEYIGNAVKIAVKYFNTVGIEIYPLSESQYTYINECGADFVSVYQETYSPVLYEKVHPSGPKRSYTYRLGALERALKSGIRGVALGALLGLGNFREDAFLTGVHADMLLKKYPHAEISFSLPRLRPFEGNEDGNTYRWENAVTERELLQVMLAYRLFMPFAGITVSTRESAAFRDNVVGLAATKISAGVSVGVGGHGQSQKGGEQFEISDTRSVAEIHAMLLLRGLQPMYNNHISL
jgi:2-iminoacetate synthase